ncbi:hypothetical protein [Staphylococcus gallinarum]|uniref:hypothetical protein n=1 Tax=Staphylococcus gallinarum TaxID=1293 RepID=UPI000D1E45C7|nr:hypothetical protein [Staphylococcus gallinarum]PTK89228.1 hypothetical protein BUZ05_12090 [Staphylococcus gallinarum]PTK92611.1 hypothetical protein BUZ13_07870 [Staphylococcus gallinarum]RIO87579.1 hypothetical protein BUZ06_10365 [Staphylococcus gallinarum]
MKNQNDKILKYPKLKKSFDILVIIGVLLLLIKFALFIYVKISGSEVGFINNNILYSIIPLLILFIGVIGSEILNRKTK